VKLLFLDIHGVLNSWSYFSRSDVEKFDGWQEAFDVEAVERLNRILESTGAVVVVSSSWRMVFGSGYIELFLRKLGFRRTIIGATPVLAIRTTGSDGRTIDRGHEIANWLNALGSRVESYVIIDDDGDMLDEQLASFVKTSMRHGLLDEHVERAIEVLGLKEAQ